MAEDHSGAAPNPAIPDRMFFRIGDVSDITGVEAHVLRFWESEFPSLSPRKTPTGQRQYRRKDVEAVLAIKQLLYVEGYTIAGARKVLRTKGGKAAGEAKAAPESNGRGGTAKPSPSALQEIRSELEQILKLLDS